MTRMSEPPRKEPYILRRPGGDVDRRRLFNAPGVVLLVAGITVLSFLLMIAAPERAARIIESAAAVSPQRFAQGAQANGGLLNMMSPLFAHMFVHAGLAHLLINTLFFMAFGAPVARRMGADDALGGFGAFYAALLFLSFYFLSGVVGALVYIAGHMSEHSLLVGASGGVSGLLGGLVRFAFNRTTLFGPERARMSPLFSPPVIAWSSIIVVMNAGVGLFGGPLAGGADVAWEAHLGGYFFGLLFYPAFERAARGGR